MSVTTIQNVEDRQIQREKTLLTWFAKGNYAKQAILQKDSRISKMDKSVIYRKSDVEGWRVSGRATSSLRAFEYESVPWSVITKSEVVVPIGDEPVTIPADLYFLRDVIEKARYILELAPGWDDEDGEAYSPETWKNAIKFVVNFSKWVYSKTGSVIEAPDIYHADRGSIDILWRTKNYRLLINIPEGQVVASFYGDNFEKDKIKGTFDINNSNQGLLLAIISM